MIPLFEGITDVRPEGGHQEPYAHAALYSRLDAWKEPPRCMFPDEFTRILRANLNRRWNCCGIASTRFGAAERKFAGLDPHGTVWFATATMREWDISIPADCIPYSTIKTAEWDMDFGRWKPTGEMVRGWRSALEQLCELGHLKPSDEMSWYIGRDSFRITPQQWGGHKPEIDDEPLDELEKFARIVSMHIDQQGSTAYGGAIGEVAVARKDYREIMKEVRSYA